MITTERGQELAADGRSRRAADMRKARRDEILQIAQQVISVRGYQATSVADVIEAAGISRGTFYLYFESREALFHELIDGFIQRLIDSIKVVRIEEGDPVGQLHANLRRVVDLLFRNRDLTVILLREAMGLGPDVERRLNALNTFLLRMVSSALVNGSRCGLIRKVNEPVIAMAILGSIKEVLYQYLVINRKDLPDPEEITTELMNFGLAGLKRIA